MNQTSDRCGPAVRLTAARLVVIGRGRLIADTTVEEFVARAGSSAAAGEVRNAEIVHAIAPDAAIRGPAHSAAFHAITTGRTPCGSPRNDHRLPGRVRLEPVTGGGSPDAQVLVRFLFVTARGPLGRQRS